MRTVSGAGMVVRGGVGERERGGEGRSGSEK
jgi:hypothetical protein